MIKSAREEHKTPLEIAEHYTKLFFDDLKESSVDDVKSYLNRRETRLDSAIFDRSDCRSCQKRNVCNLLLFDSSEETCLDCSCFERKTHETVLEEIKSIKGKNLKIY